VVDVEKYMYPVNTEEKIEEILGHNEKMKLKQHNETYVTEFPKCVFCDDSAVYDGKTTMGPWANMCNGHFRIYGVGLGLGKGQKLIKK